MQILSYLQSLNSHVCLSGGAAGSDLEWGNAAKSRGHSVIHWSFENHRSLADKNELIELSTGELDAAIGAVKRANASLKRTFPASSVLTNNLLCRNWYQVANTDAVYATSDFDSNQQIKGGTAWAIQMYIDRFIHDGEDVNNCKLYVYSSVQNVWWTWRNKWSILTSPPEQPSGLWTGIGARKLTTSSKWQIRKLFGTTSFSQHDVEEMFPLVTTPRINDVIYLPDVKIPGKGIDNSTGGWGRVHNIQKCSDTLTSLSVVELPGKFFNWNNIVDQQAELRSQLLFTRAELKPDDDPHNNHLIPCYRLKP